MFPSWAALKKHLIGPAHVRMTVICPWCTGRERTFTRVADLKQHASNQHKHQFKESNFSRGVGFYYAKYPVDYIKIVDYVAPYLDDSACEARSAMRKWAETMEGSASLMERLNRGWKAERSDGKKTRTKERSRSRDDVRKVVEVEVQEVNAKGDSSGRKKDRTETQDKSAVGDVERRRENVGKLMNKSKRVEETAKGGERKEEKKRN